MNGDFKITVPKELQEIIDAIDMSAPIVQTEKTIKDYKNKTMKRYLIQIEDANFYYRRVYEAENLTVLKNVIDEATSSAEYIEILAVEEIKETKE